MKRLQSILFAFCLWVLSPQAWCDEFNPTSPGDPNPAYRLTVMVDPVAGGTAKIASSAVSHTILEPGKRVSLSITPNADFTFVQWVCGEQVLSTYSSFTYTMPDHDVLITAQMLYNEPDPFNPTSPGDPTGEGPAKPRHRVVLFTSPEAGGSAYPSNFFLREDESRELTASPAAGYEFAGWYRDGQLESMTNPVTLTMHKEDVSLTAHFRFNPVSPEDPGVNYLNVNTGEMIIDHFTPGHLVDAVRALTENYERILYLTVVGEMNSSDYNFIRNCIHIRTADFSRTTGYKNTTAWSFSGLTELQTVMLPASIETMGNQAFYNCTSLSEIVLYSPVPPTATRPADVFHNVPEGLSVRVPAEALSLYQASTLWNQFSLMPMDMKTLTVQLPGADIDLYQDMFLELLDTKSGQQRRYVVTQRSQYAFSGVFNGTIYQLTLRNAQGVRFGQEMIEFKGTDMNVSFASLLRPAKATALVKDKDGNDVTDQVTLTWYDVEGNYLSKSLSIAGLVEKEVLQLRVELNEQLGRQYIEPAQLQQVYLHSGNNIAEVALQAVPTKLFRGVVTDQTGVALANPTVLVTQQLNGKYTFTTTIASDGKGVFSGEIPDVPYEVTVSANYYQKRVLTDETMPADGNIALSRLKGTYVYVTLPPFTSIDGKSNLLYTIYDITQERAIEEFAEYDGCLMLAERLPGGDRLRVTATSKSGGCNPATAICTVEPDGATAYITMPLVRYGDIKVEYTASANEASVAVLYDSEGKFVQRQDFHAKEAAFLSLPDGTYTLVVMGAYAPLNQLETLAQLTQAGMQLNTDYVQKSVTVQSGVTTNATFTSVPLLDETKFNYTGTAATFRANQHVVVVGNYITLTGDIGFKPEYSSASNVRMVVEIPENCRFVDNSVMVGSSVAPYTVASNRLTIELPSNSGQVRFCAFPTEAGEYVMNAFVEFSLADGSHSQPLGAAVIEAEALSINVPEMSARKEITVSGSAMPRSHVVIYDNKSSAGVATAAANGQWQKTIELYTPYDFSEHKIYAQVTTPEGVIMQTETRNVTYNRNGVEVSYITMNYINAEEHKEYEMVFDMLYPTKTPNKYRYGPANRNFDFTVNFTKNDPEVISDVELFVKTKNGLWHAVKTEYDEVHGDWRGSEYYDGVNNNLPVNVDAGFVLTSGEPVGTGLAFRAQMENLTTFSQLAEMITDWHSISWYTYEEGENYSKIRLENQLSDDYVLILMETLDYEQTLPQLGQKQFAFTPIPHGYFCLYDEFNDDYYEATVLNSADQWAYKIRVARPGKPLSPRRTRRAGEMSTDEVIAEFTAEQSQLFTQGLELYTGITSLGERADATGLKQMVELLAAYVKQQKNKYARVEETISAKDVYGDYVLSDAQRGEFTRQLNQIARRMDDFQSKYALYLEAYSNMLREVSMYNMTIMLLSKTTRPSLAHGVISHTRRGGIIPEEEEQYWKEQAQLANEALENELNYTGWQIFFETSDVVEPGNENPDQDVMDEIADEQDEVMQELDEMQKTVTRVIPAQVQVAGKAVQPRKGLNPDALVSYDPAGFVYEAVSDNRIEGVKATVYYKETKENVFGEMVDYEHMWDASEYDQENPLYTDEQGYYQWFVPEGLWQVRFEKAGYEPAQSEWLPVPPPQLEVNIPIVQLSQPEVLGATAYPSAIDITFDKYMEPELLNTENIFLMAGDLVVPGTIELPDLQFAYGNAGKMYASQARFIPSERLTVSQVTLSVSQRVRSYAGIPMRETFQQVFDVEPDQQQIDEEAANAVIALINAIGEVTLEREPAIVEARTAYDALTETQQALVTNYEVLTAAEETLALLKSTYTVTFVNYDGETLKTQVVRYSLAAEAPEVPAREGYTFTGWDKDFSHVTTDLTVTAQFSINLYTVTFVDYDGATLKTQTVDWNTAATAPVSPSREGYTFTGWDADFSHVTGNLTVTAQYAIITYIVTFVDWNGTVLKTQTVDWGTAAVAPADPTREGYTFSGWDIPFSDVKSALTVTAQYTINSYTVTFKDHDGTVLKTETVNYGDAATAPADPVRSGWTFSGWDKAFNVVTGDLVVTARYTVNPVYTVVFVDYNSAVISEQQVEQGQAAIAPTDPIREGYTFTGWDATFTHVTMDMTIHAQYSINSYTLTYQVDGEVYGTPQSIEYGAALTPADAPASREGYTFSGWSEIPATMPAHDVVINGTFTINSYTVTFQDWNGETIGAPQRITYGGAAVAPTAPAREGYTFTGWDKRFDNIKSDLVVVAQYRINTFTVTFVDWNGTVLKTQTVDWNTAAAAPADPTREGYTFSGWDVPFGIITADLTVTAQYSINVYRLSYMAQGAEVAFDSITYQAPVDVTLHNGDAPAKEGYTFTGWTPAITSMPAHNDTVTAVYVINTYTVTFKDWNGTVLGTQTVNWNTAATAPADPAREGHTFIGWDRTFAQVTENMVVTAQYTINQYTVTFKDWNGTVLGTQTVDWNTAAEAPADPSREGYTFTGWDASFSHVKANSTVMAQYSINTYRLSYMAQGAEVAFDSLVYLAPVDVTLHNGDALAKEGYTFTGWAPAITNMPAHNDTVKAVYVINTYTVTFKNWDGTVLSTQTVNWGEGAQEPAHPTREGYTFAGWDQAFNSVKTNLVVTANYTQNPVYTVTFVNWNDSVIASVRVEEGQAATAPNTPAREGYTFTGWSADFSHVMGNMTIRAQYSINRYALIYLLDGEPYATDTMEYNAMVTPMDAPAAREGYTFRGWSEIPATMPAHDVVITGSFAINSYRLTYKVDGEVYGAVDSLAYNAAVVLRAEPTKTGYTFSGWSGAVETMPAHDVVISGTFTVNKYAVTYLVDGEIFAVDSIAYSAAVTPRSEPTREGYTFSGWSTIPATMPAYDVEVSGTFSVNTYALLYKVDGVIYSQTTLYSNA